MFSIIYCVYGVCISVIVEIQLILFNISLFLKSITFNEHTITYCILFDFVIIILHTILGVILIKKKEKNFIAQSIASKAVKLYENAVWIQVLYFVVYSSFVPGLKDNPLYFKIASGIFVSVIIGLYLYVNELVVCKNR